MGVKGGGEIALHAARATMQHVRQSGDPVVALKLDFANAYCTVHREVFLAKIKSNPELSCLYSFVKMRYGQESTLMFGTHPIACQTGVQQGDPLGSLLFCLALTIVVDAVQEAAPTLLLHQWFADDGFTIGDVATSLKALATVQRVAPTVGLQLKLSKCEVAFLGNEGREEALAQFPPELKRCPGADMEYMGGALGGDAFITQRVEGICDKVDATLEVLGSFDDAQVELALLRHCLGVCKFVYHLRTTPPQLMPGAIDRIDGLLHKALTSILGAPPTPAAMQQASLPTHLGGLGITLASQIAAAAYLSSVAQAIPHMATIVQIQQAQPAHPGSAVPQGGIIPPHSPIPPSRQEETPVMRGPARSGLPQRHTFRAHAAVNRRVHARTQMETRYASVRAGEGTKAMPSQEGRGG